MALIILVPIYFIVNYYIIRRSISWMRCMTRDKRVTWVIKLYAALYIFLSLTMLLPMFMDYSIMRYIIKRVSNYWLGFQLYIIMFIGLADLVKIVLMKLKVFNSTVFESKRNFIISGSVVALCVCIFGVYGISNRYKIRDTHYDIHIDKDGGNINELDVVLVADLHLGYNSGVRELEDMVESINEKDADIVIIAGDIFDNEYEALDDPEHMEELLASIKSEYGVYACYGNHDVDEMLLGGFSIDDSGEKLRDESMNEFMERSEIIVLNDESVCIEDSIYLVGRMDYSNTGEKGVSRLGIDELMESVDNSKPVILIDHQPKELEEISQVGVDIDLSGHTHNGQVFPGNMIIDFFWDNAYGCQEINDMYSIVTSGIGVWGPAMRVGTKCEVVEIEVTFN